MSYERESGSLIEWCPPGAVSEGQSFRVRSFFPFEVTSPATQKVLGTGEWDSETRPPKEGANVKSPIL